MSLQVGYFVLYMVPFFLSPLMFNLGSIDNLKVKVPVKGTKPGTDLLRFQKYWYSSKIATTSHEKASFRIKYDEIK